MKKIPDRIFRDVDDKDLYDRLKNEKLFKDKNLKEKFIYALTLGYKNNISVPIKLKEGLFYTKDLSENDEALLSALAIYTSEKGIDILIDKAEIYKIAEEYAHAGIRLLIDNIDSTPYGSYEKIVEKELSEIFNDFLTAENA